MNDMFGINISPFQGFCLLWHCHFTGFHPVLASFALSGLQHAYLLAPKGLNLLARWHSQFLFEQTAITPHHAKNNNLKPRSGIINYE